MDESQKNDYPEYPSKDLIDNEIEANIQPKEYPQSNQNINPQGFNNQNEVNPQPEVYPQNNQYMNSHNIDFNQNKEESFEDITITSQIRTGFIIKTYGIILCQLLISTLFVFLSFIPSVKDFFTSEKNSFFTFFNVIFLVVTITVCIVFACCRETARAVPINYILLFSFTLCMSFYLLLICAQYETTVVIAALILTMAATIGLTFYAYIAKANFTFLGGFLFSMILVSLLCFPLFYWIGGMIIYCLLGIMLYSVYIIYDTQLILGKLGIEYNIDDYCLAALNLYLDIIYLFIRILALLGRRN